LRAAREPVEILLVERRADYRCGGTAYHRDGNPWDHVFNIQAGRMSVFREDVDDFLNWANYEAIREDWPEPWCAIQFVESGPAPRRIYQWYLEDRLAQASLEAFAGVELTEAVGEVIDVRAADSRITVVIEEPADGDLDGNLPPPATRREIAADHVVLSTGLEVKTPGFAAQVLSHPAFVREPYSRAGIERILESSPGDTILVVGSVLSAYDAAALLLRRGHWGKIYLVSRSGMTLRTYPLHHQHEVIQLPPPELSWYDDGVEGFVRRARAQWKAACSEVLRARPDIDPAVVPERVAKAWEPYVSAVLDQIPTSDLQELLTDHSTILATARVGAMGYTTELV